MIRALFRWFLFIVVSLGDFAVVVLIFAQHMISSQIAQGAEVYVCVQEVYLLVITLSTIGR